MLFCWRNLLALSLSLGPLALGLTTSQQSQLKLEPSHLPDAKDLEHIQLELGYTFNDTDLLRLALIHPSVGQINNARLAWLGDAILEMVVSHNAYRELPFDVPGRLHKVRQSLLDTNACVSNAKKLNLLQYFIVGKSFKPDDQHPTPHMVADLFEAVLAAVYIDAGYSIDAAQHLYNAHFA